MIYIFIRLLCSAVAQMEVAKCVAQGEEYKSVLRTGLQSTQFYEQDINISLETNIKLFT